MNKETQQSSEDSKIIRELTRLIELDAHTESLTVAKMAKVDLANGLVDSAILRLRVDRDKFIYTNSELYEYLDALLTERGFQG